MSANYAIYTSPTHQPIPDHLPTLIITPHGKPHQVLYTYLHTNYNQENYLLTPSDQGDLCVAKLFPSHNKRSIPSRSSDSPSNPQSSVTPTSDRSTIKCEASRNLRWTIRNEGIQHPVYKLTLPNPENPQLEQPLFQVSKPNPNSPWWSLFYFTYAGHLIPPKRIEFGKIVKAPAHGPNASGETKITVTGKTEEEKAVWCTLGEGNEDMVEWILVCAALNVLDEEITKATEAAGLQLSARPSLKHSPKPVQQRPHEAPPSHQQQQPPSKTQDRQLHPTGSTHRPPASGAIRPAIYNKNQPPSNKSVGPPSSQPIPAHPHPKAGNGLRGPPPPNHHHPIQHAHPSSVRGGPGYAGSLPPGAMPPGALPPGVIPPGALPPGAMPSGRGPVPHRQGSVPPEAFSDGHTSLPYARSNLPSATPSRSSPSPHHHATKLNQPHPQTRSPQYHPQQQHHDPNQNPHRSRPPNSHRPGQNPNHISPSPTPAGHPDPNPRAFVNNNQSSASRATIQRSDYPISRPKQVR